MNKHNHEVKNTILHSEYLKALAIVKHYENQIDRSIVKLSDISINQKVKLNYPESKNYWVSEINGEDFLIRTTEIVKSVMRY